ncbi:copper chaperone PCu(A)C [Mesorhizobium sp. IMUNJ 23033]|uniref:copper chaperone PCu(A)C n=1 Tax=Mesorhizobium sp. IMUNJ 23033 TaxID=3378039 RepID=UPI00384E9268
MGESQPQGRIAAYLTLVNNGSESDGLIDASSSVAENVQFHEEKIENGIATGGD